LILRAFFGKRALSDSLLGGEDMEKQGINKEILKQLSGENLNNNIAQENQKHILSIVFDAINSIVGGLIITDTNGIICFTNPSFLKMFEYKQEDIIGINATALFTTKEVRKFSDVISMIDISKDDTEEFMGKKKDGVTFAVEVSASNVISTATNQILGRMASFVDITARKEVENDRETLISKLQNAIDTIKTLKGIIPICSYCKKIRNDSGAWDQMEAYISAHSEAHFSHGACPECYKKAMGELVKGKNH
jgi:PAS domain S-box-containing protein